MWIAGADTNNEIREQFYTFRDKVPFIKEDSKGHLFYSPEIKLNKNSNLKIAYPLIVICGFEGLRTFTQFQDEHIKNDYFIYTFKVNKEPDRFYELIFAKKYLTFRCTLIHNQLNIRSRIFEYYFNYRDIQFFISDGCKFIDYPQYLQIDECYNIGKNKIKEK